MVTPSYGQSVSFTTKEKNLPCLDKQFSVFVHVYADSFANGRITEDSIHYALQEANRLFSPICVSFAPCIIDTFPYYQFDSLRADDFLRLKEMQNRYDKLFEVINIHVISSVELKDSDAPYGFAYFNGISTDDSCSLVITKSALKTDPLMLTHLLGHLFGLYDTYGDGQELVDGSNCQIAGDKICDTPADPVSDTYGDAYVKLSTLPDEKCLFIDISTDLNGAYYVPDVANIMSKYNQCYCTFSRQQYLRMAENYLNSQDKKW